MAGRISAQSRKGNNGLLSKYIKNSWDVRKSYLIKE